MQYRELGASGLRLSVVGFGTWQNVTPDDQPKATALVRSALEAGINFFDTADGYGNGGALAALGVALRGTPRESYTLASKVYYPTGPGPDDRGLSRKHLMTSVDQSLRLAGTEYLDILQAHRRQHQLQQARRAVYLQANLDLTAAVEAAEDFVSSWHGHQADAPVHDHATLLRAANTSLLNVSLLGSKSSIASSEELRRVVQSSRDLEFTDNLEEVSEILERFGQASRPLLRGWQARLRTDLGVE